MVLNNGSLTGKMGNISKRQNRLLFAQQCTLVAVKKMAVKTLFSSPLCLRLSVIQYKVT